MVATKRLRLAMETDEERKARLEKMIATTQLRLTLETEDIMGWVWLLVRLRGCDFHTNGEEKRKG